LLAACGNYGPQADPRVAACERVGGAPGDLGKCTKRYGDTDYGVYLNAEGSLNSALADTRASCKDDSALFRAVFHADTGVCEQRERSFRDYTRRLERELADERPSRSERARRLRSRARDSLCDGSGGGALTLARRADRLKPTQASKQLIGDARTLIAQQARNRELPESQARIPAILTSRCGIEDKAAVGEDCSDFDSQAEAQAFLDDYGDVSGLDRDGDGIACETLDG
jgi:hypothetical protein